MTDVQHGTPRFGAQSASELYIEFDGQQLTIGTDVPDMHEFLANEYAAMLVPAQRESIGRIDFLRNGKGYSVRGIREAEYAAPLGSLFESVKAEVMFHFISSRQDLMWLHASAVEYDGRATLFAGPSGNGKSTMATLLYDRGWQYLSDDIAPISMKENTVLPFAQTPRRRIYPGREFPPQAIGLLEREAVPIDPDRVRRVATTIAAIVFPVFCEGVTAELNLVAAGDAALKLIRDCTNFADHKAAAVSRAVEMAQTIPVYALTYSSGADAAQLLDSFR